LGTTGQGPEPVSSNSYTGSYQNFHKRETFRELLTKRRKVITRSEEVCNIRLGYCVKTVLMIIKGGLKFSVIEILEAMSAWTYTSDGANK
jgi:hypothetical protein